VVAVVFREEVVVLVRIDLHMKVVIVVVVNNVHNVLINLKDNQQEMNQVVLNKVVKLGQMKQEMIIKHLVVIVVVVAVDAVILITEVLKKVEVVVVEAVAAVAVAILITEILKKVHNNDNNNQHKKAVDGNKAPSM